MSGVIGHTTVLPDGILCGCGNHGCLETVASGQAIQRAARNAVEAGSWHPTAPIDDLSAHVIAFARARRRSGGARVLHRCGYRARNCAGERVCLLNLEAIVVGGGVARAGDLLLDPIRREIQRRTTVFSPERGGVTVVQSSLDGYAGAIGCALVALRLDETVSLRRRVR